MSNTTNTDSLMSAKEVAALLSVSTSLIYQYKDDGTLNAVPIPKSTKIAFARSDVEAFLAELLEQRRVAPLADHTGHRNNDIAGLSKAELAERENYRMNRKADWKPEDKDAEWNWSTDEESADDK